MREVTTKLYRYEELDDAAKEKARDWFREEIENDDLMDCIIDDVCAIAAILGVEFRTHAVPLMNGSARRDPNIYWSGFSSQGDGACYEGSYAFVAGAPAAIRAHAPQDERLHRIADALAAVQRRHFYGLEAGIVQRGRYSHSGAMEVDVSDRRDRDVSADAAEVVIDALRDFADWIYRSLESEWEYRQSDEVVAENIQANEYEFTADGERA